LVLYALALANFLQFTGSVQIAFHEPKLT
jgi:hypothetical protein